MSEHDEHAGTIDLRSHDDLGTFLHTQLVIGDLFNVAQYALNLTMTARYEWHGIRQDARSAVRAARRALSAI
jgi:hypothetical protein